MESEGPMVHQGERSDLEEVPEGFRQAGDCIIPNLRIRLNLNAAVLDCHTGQMTTCTIHTR